MIRYYARRSRTRTAETRRMAQRLTRRGYRRCRLADWRAARKKQEWKSFRGLLERSVGQ